MTYTELRITGRQILVFACLLSTFQSLEAGNPSLANGLGDHIDWVEWKDALKLAKEENKPLMVVIHKTGCPACKSLKPKFSASKEIDQLSSSFVMVNANNGAEPSSESFLAPDGSYVPRILFLDPQGNLLEEVINEKGNPSYKYYHFESESVVESMKKALGPIKDEL